MADSKVPWTLKLLVIGSFIFKLTLLNLDLYRSTDFEVHRNWLAITHSLPFREWYIEDTSHWTLDYPPLFGVFEWALSQPAALVDPKMLDVKNLEYASRATIVFQRCSVIVGDLVLLVGAMRLAFSVAAPKSSPDRAAWVAAALLLCSPGLILVDHVHFQYNGMMLGILLWSAADIEAGNHYRGAAWFCILLNMKQIFLYVAPVYFVYLLRVHCGLDFTGGFRLCIRALFKLGVEVVAIFAAVWVPVLLTGQGSNALSRLFPFGRGLTHAYWAPNVWALYNTADRALAKLGFAPEGGAAGSTAGFAEVFESSVLWTIPPKATFALTLAAYVPLSILIWRQTRPSSAARAQRGLFPMYVALGCAIAFACGWHVHEKAILMVTVPMMAAVPALIGSDTDSELNFRQAAFALSVTSTFSMLPLLPQRSTETIFKWLLLIGGHLLEWKLLRIPARSTLCHRVGGWLPVWLLFLAIAALGLYVDFGGHTLIFRGRMEFLPLLLMSDFSAIVVLSSFCRLTLCVAHFHSRQKDE